MALREPRCGDCAPINYLVELTIVKDPLVIVVLETVDSKNTYARLRSAHEEPPTLVNTIVFSISSICHCS